MLKTMPFFMIVLILSIGATFAYLKLAPSQIPECQKDVTCFTKASEDKKLVKNAQDAIKNGNYTIEGYSVEAEYMTSTLSSYITPKEVTDYTTTLLPQKASKSDSKIKFIIYENDKESPNKKSDNCKLFAGYLVYEFYYQEQLAYKIQIDFLEEDKEEIKKRIDCVVESFMAL
ncbi:MAG: hypothetical protein ACLFOC_06560 [Campylobacterales bacterium]